MELKGIPREGKGESPFIRAWQDNSPPKRARTDAGQLGPIGDITGSLQLNKYFKKKINI
jgi:hypothetical protein